MKSEDPAVRKLLAENEAFQRLWSRHLQYERQLAELDRIHYLTPEQELERRTIQKLKLAGKDEMAQMLREAGSR
jgi:hypothetical protein